MISESRTQANGAHWVGIDVAKHTFQAALARPGQKWPATPLRELPVKKFQRTGEGLAELAAWLDSLTEGGAGSAAFRAVMESTGKYSVELAAWMCERYPRIRPSIVNAQQTHAYLKSMNLRGKTDAIEARALAFYGIEREPVAFEPLGPVHQQFRDLVRHRAHLVQLRIALTNRQGEGAEAEWVRQSQARLVEAFDEEIAQCEKEMRTLVAADDDLKRDVALLSSIYGVAFVVASTIRAELGDLRRFTRARQLTAFAGLNPRQRQSGSSINKPARLSKKGNGHVRKALYMAALTAIHDNGAMQRTYTTLCNNGKPKMVALGAVMRKLLVLMRALLLHEERYDPKWKTRQQKSAERAPA